LVMVRSSAEFELIRLLSPFLVILRF